MGTTVGSQFGYQMLWTLKHYKQEGKKAKTAAAAGECEHGGNPLGKKPEALCRALHYRLSQLLTHDKAMEISQLFESEGDKQKVQEAMLTINRFGSSQHKGTDRRGKVGKAKR